MPAFTPGKNRDGIADFAIFNAFEMRVEQAVELLGLDAERRALELIAEEEIAGQQSACRQELGDAAAPVIPQLARQGAEEGALVDQSERLRRLPGEEIGADQLDRVAVKVLKTRCRTCRRPARQASLVAGGPSTASPTSASHCRSRESGC